MYDIGKLRFALTVIKTYYANVNSSLKTAVLNTSFLIVLALVTPIAAQSQSDLGSPPLSPAPYRVGERLTYNVSFSNFISAAHVEIFVAAHGTFFDREGIQLRARVETTGVVNAALYAINNDYITYIDPYTGLPFLAQQVLRESAKRSDRSMDFTQPTGIGAIPPKQRKAGFPGTYDLLSAIYRLRALPLSEGSTYQFTVRGDNQDYRAEIKVTGRQMIRTNVGSFNALASQIRVLNDSSANRYRIRIYFSDDERHIPVLITAQHSAGEIRAELAGSEFVKPAPQKTDVAPPVIVAGPSQPSAPVAHGNNGGALLDLPFQVGEQLNYQVFLPSVSQPVGTATFQVRGHSRYFDRDGLLFTVAAQTTNAAQRLFVANDQISSYADPKTLLPFRTEMNLVEGNRRLNQILNLNQTGGQATTDSGQRIEIPVGTHDYLSLFYAIRTFNLSPPRRNAISILVDNRPRTLFVSALKRETIQLGSQSIPAIQVSLTTDDAEGDKFQFRAWISDDDRKLPLRLTAATPLGVIRADLAILPVTRQ